MAMLTLTMLGGFEARAGSRAIALPRKVQALLAYLALAPTPTPSRSKLATLLWSDVVDEDARNNLRQVLFRTRRALGRAAVVLSVDGETVSLDTQAVSSDVAGLRRLVTEGSAESLRAAARLWRGPLLDGLDVGQSAFEEWLTVQREQLHQLAVGALLDLLRREEEQKALPGVVAAGLQLVSLDPLQEEAHRALMRAYVGLGRRAAALRQYQICLDVLQRELQAEPEPDTKALYLDLLRHSSIVPRAVEPAAVWPRAPLTGREVELAVLTSVLDGALAGTRRTAVVLGEAGVGKTRLVEELVADAAARGCLVLQARAYETETGLPLALWVGAFRSAGVVEDRAVIEALGSEWRDALNPLFRELPGRRRRGSVETENQLRIFEALSRLVATVAAARPVVLVLEDLQWADATSLRFLAFLGRRLSAARACIVLTARLEDIEHGGTLTTVLSELPRDGGLDEITLRPLTRAETLRLVESLVPRQRDRIQPEHAERVWRMSAGNPFVITEAVRPADQGRGADPGADLPLPERVRRLIVDRLDRLGPAARRLVDAAAVVGGAFEYQLVRRAAAMPDEDAAAGVEELVRRRIFRQVGEAFDFAHDRVRETALAALLTPQQRRLHRSVAEAIEETRAHDLDDQYAALASHYQQGEDWPRAIDCLRQASMLTACRGAFREAADLLEQALRLLAHLPRNQETLALAVDIRIELWDRVLVLPDFRRGEECLLEALSLAGELKDERRTAFVGSSLANHDVQLRKFERGRRLAEDALAVGERLREGVIAARAANALGYIRYHSGDLENAIAAFGRGIEAAGDDPLTSFSVGAGLCHVHLRGSQAIVLSELGRFEEALRLADDAFTRAESVLNVFSMAFARLSFARVHLLRGDFERALQHLESGFDLVETYDIGLVRRLFVVWLPVAYAGVGRPESAMELVSQGPPVWPITHIARARALLAAGRAGDATAAAEEALAAARRIGEQTQETIALLVLAETLEGENRSLELARSYCEGALGIATALGLRAYEAHGHRQLGELLAAGADRKKARHHLTTALALYRDMGMQRWVGPADARLNSLDVQ